ncbi:MAG TPA: sialidase family protein [Nitrososphaera sp.]
MISILLPLLLILASPISTAPVSTATTDGDDDNNEADTVTSTLYSIWVEENGADGNPDVFFARSDDGGETFGDPINLSNNDDWSTQPKIAVADNHVHVVWLDSPSELDEGVRATVTVRSSDDGGETFGDPVLVSEREVGQPFSRLNILQIDATTTAADGNDDDSNVYIGWVAGPGGQYAGRLNFARSDDSGQNFELLTGLVRGVDNIEMEVVASGSDKTDDRIYIAGQASSENDITLAHQIFFVRSTDGGKTFDDPILLEDADPNEGDSIRFESMEVDDDQIQVTWMNGYLEPRRTHFAVSVDGGETWG